MPSENLYYTNLLGVVSPVTKKVYFCLQDIEEILQIRKELKINSQKTIRQQKKIRRIYPTCHLKDILHPYEEESSPCPVVEYHTLLSHLERNKYPKKKMDLFKFFETQHVLELEEIENVRQLHPCVDSIGKAFSSWICTALYS